MIRNGYQQVGKLCFPTLSFFCYYRNMNTTYNISKVETSQKNIHESTYENTHQSTRIEQKDFHTHPLLARLLHLPQIPKHIFYRGTLPDVKMDKEGRSTPRILTVVGSRKHTSYACDVIAYLLSAFSPSEVIIVSGLALGIDALAHHHALENKLTTLSIPGSGLAKEVLYPKSNYMLAQKILESGGCLLSEYEDTTKAALWSFPARNRLMASLSDAVLLIEAEEKSGTLITARYALELGINCAIIPNSIFSPNSKGTHALLKDGAIPITSHDDIRELLHLKERDFYTEEKNDTEIIKNLNDHERIIFTLLTEKKSIDTLIIESKLSPQEIMIAITNLEIQRYVQNTFGELQRIV